MEDLVRLSGGLCAAVFALGVVMAFRGAATAGLMELQLATDPEEARNVIPKQDAPRRKVLLRLIKLDFAFIAAYWFAFGALAILLSHRGGIFVAVAAAALMLGTTAALLDLLENVRTLGVLSLHRESDQVRREVLDNLRTTALAKWNFGFLTTAALSALFWGIHPIAFLGAFLLLVALLGLYAVRTAGPRRIALAFLAQGAGLAVVASIFSIWPGWFLEAF